MAQMIRLAGPKGETKFTVPGIPFDFPTKVSKRLCRELGGTIQSATTLANKPLKLHRIFNGEFRDFRIDA